MIREEAMVIEWSSDPHPADRGELWDSSLHDEIHKLRIFVEGLLGQNMKHKRVMDVESIIVVILVWQKLKRHSGTVMLHDASESFTC